MFPLIRGYFGVLIPKVVCLSGLVSFRSGCRPPWFVVGDAVLGEVEPAGESSVEWSLFSLAVVELARHVGHRPVLPPSVAGPTGTSRAGTLGQRSRHHTDAAMGVLKRK